MIPPVRPDFQPGRDRILQGTRFQIVKQVRILRCDIVIVGGTTAAIAAALAAVLAGADVVLIEPTNWLGGQLTSSAVSAVDWGNVSGLQDIARASANVTKSFDTLLQRVKRPGGAWVGDTVFLPNEMARELDRLAKPWEGKQLTILRETVIKEVEPGEGHKITSITALRAHRPRTYQTLPSADIRHWYNRAETDECRIQGKFSDDDGTDEDQGLVVIDATEWGEVLALANADHTVGAEGQEDHPKSCVPLGQATVFDFVQELRGGGGPPYDRPESTFVFLPLPRDSTTVDAKGVRHAHTYGFDKGFWDATEQQVAHHPSTPPDDEVMWHIIWRYRRLDQDLKRQRSRLKPIKDRQGHVTTQDAESRLAHVGDRCLQNWGRGNDYYGGYLFGSGASIDQGNWEGGVDYQVMAAAEQQAKDWHSFFGNKNPVPGTYVDLAKDAVGTGHGLSKVPYIRDTRRSIGITVSGFPEGFRLKSKDLLPVRGSWAERPDDAVAIGNYRLDMHLLPELSKLVNDAAVASQDRQDHDFAYLSTSTEPGLFYIPFRALTNGTVPNLLVAGKTMAQSFLANAATRLHPIEWATGTAAGVAAAMMVTLSRKKRRAVSTTELYEDRTNLLALLEEVRKQTPTEWTPPHG